MHAERVPRLVVPHPRCTEERVQAGRQALGGEAGLAASGNLPSENTARSRAATTYT